MIINDCQAKPRIDYPCPWLFKVIGFEMDEIEKAIGEVLGDAVVTVSASKASSSGKYQSVNLEMEVAGEEERDAVYKNLSAHAAIKVVL
ncbi:MAG: DUF493 domain-containing protein [Thermodesulfobacteriota bacterium]